MALHRVLYTAHGFAYVPARYDALRDQNDDHENHHQRWPDGESRVSVQI